MVQAEGGSHSAPNGRTLSTGIYNWWGPVYMSDHQCTCPVEIWWVVITNLQWKTQAQL